MDRSFAKALLSPSSVSTAPLDVTMLVARILSGFSQASCELPHMNHSFIGGYPVYLATDSLKSVGSRQILWESQRNWKTCFRSPCRSVTVCVNRPAFLFGARGILTADVALYTVANEHLALLAPEELFKWMHGLRSLHRALLLQGELSRYLAILPTALHV